MDKAIYQATRKEIGRYNNLDWKITYNVLILISALLFLYNKEPSPKSFEFKTLIILINILICGFFIFTRFFILHTVNKEREVQRIIESKYCESPNSSILNSNRVLFCHQHTGPVSKWYRPFWAISQSTAMFLYSVYILFVVIKTP